MVFNLVANWFNQYNYEDVLLGGTAGALFATFVIITILFLVAIYVYHALAWMTIAKKMKHKYPWLAWIPFASSAMRLQLGKYPWPLIFLIIIPIIGWIAIVILLTIAHWRIFEKLKYPNWLALAFPLMFIPRISFIGSVLYLVTIGVVAWRK